MLTVVIPVRNSAGTLGEQLDALARQTFEGDWEVVIADNESTDSSCEIAKAHVGHRGRLRVIDASQRKGAAYRAEPRCAGRSGGDHLLLRC